ncbi:MAG TPA: amidohydrolase family protein [Streptosporangiaceae bacterium]|nr:amidohydrolase family protein [Streptosporangiaceae bacterium]
MSDSLAEKVGALALVDHHAHPALAAEVLRPGFEALITESDRVAPAGTTQFDSQLGIALRRWCAPVLGLPPSPTPEDYLARRAEVGADEVARRFLRASGVAHFLVDTGYQLDGALDLAEMGESAQAKVDEVVRLEQVAEQVVQAGDGTAAGFLQRFEAALWDRTAQARAVKSIIAYRMGLGLDPDPPAAAEVAAAAGRWLAEVDQGGTVRVSDPVLLRFLLWAGVDRGLPLQVHTGFGDPSADLRQCDPLLLRTFLERIEGRPVPVLLLHCYPYHRQAGYLAHAYPHVYLDVGLALNHVGARAAAVVAESLELAPFTKVLFSSDGFGLPELHYLGASLWRRATAQVLGEWVASGEWSHADAVRAATMIGAGNAARIYRLG